MKHRIRDVGKTVSAVTNLLGKKHLSRQVRFNM